MAGKIFINYRKALSLEQAQTLHAYLQRRFSPRRLYLDVHGLEAGSDWFSELERQVHGSAVMLVLIPEGWAEAVDEQGRRRLDDPQDFVRFEITTALRRKVDLLPVLVNMTEPPRFDQLPQPLWPLLAAQATRFRAESYALDAGVIAKEIRELLVRRPAKRSRAALAAAAAVALAIGVGAGTQLWRAPELGFGFGFGLESVLGPETDASLSAALEEAERRAAAAQARAARALELERQLAEARQRLADVETELSQAREAAERLPELETELETELAKATEARDAALTRVSALEAQLREASQARDDATARAQAAEAAAARLRDVAPEAVFAAPPSARSTRIRRAQELLAALGYDVGDADGALGRKTRAALEAFQAAAGLAATGDVEMATLDALALARRYAASIAANAANAKPTRRDGEIFRDDCEVCPEMVVIPAGSFQMGSNDGASDEKPVHRVTVPRFAIGEYEVTRAEYARFVAATGHQGRRCYTYDGERGTSRGWVDDADWRSSGIAQEDDHPVVCVSWDDAQAYVAWLNDQVDGAPYRLPSEAEWEYAARAGSSDRYAFGDDESRLGDYAWYSGNSGSKTQPVGEKQANDFGLHDMHGNVWEWVRDCWHGSYDHAPDDGSAWMNADNGDCSAPVLRGGSWGNGPWFLRSTNRLRNLRDVRYSRVGFRLVRTLGDD